MKKLILYISNDEELDLEHSLAKILQEAEIIDYDWEKLSKEERECFE